MNHFSLIVKQSTSPSPEGMRGSRRISAMRSQKNGAVVRQFVGHERLVGLQAYFQLRKLYRAVHLYVNAFQPSMKLLSKCYKEGKVQRVYDPAKTPLQRLLLCGILPTHQQRELGEVGEALDPLSLLRQVEHLQQALRHCAATTLPRHSSGAATSVQSFHPEHCLPGALPFSQGGGMATVAPPTRRCSPPSEAGLLDWPRTIRDPFEGVWEQLLSLVLIHPEWSGSDLFEEIQRASSPDAIVLPNWAPCSVGCAPSVPACSPLLRSLGHKK